MSKTTAIGGGIYSYLSPAELKELKRCVAIAYRQSDRKRQFTTLACQPNAAKRFVKHPHFKVTQ